MDDRYLRCPTDDGGMYDYYVLHDGLIYGMASCDDALYPLSDEEAEAFRNAHIPYAKSDR
ncbi:hypothetical protein JNUCC32_31015 (plasmid) [Paenibacillus sp. JNUCC32]|uniref:hypothetical protein n=1 Tax=Paenibacillus sp. JNUCC32 TaxID=2777984 RepID=UPI0017886428|nr:hypothetical protein [Paenibacillus sp. JNUCC-32]QOT13720.1 hypothetical protein JNUCC32_31015 [Paenibacillus sp. JNUCC-32]